MRVERWLQAPTFVFKPGAWCDHFRGFGELRPVHRKGPVHDCSACHPRRYVKQQNMDRLLPGTEQADYAPAPKTFNDTRPSYTVGLSVEKAALFHEIRRITPAWEEPSPPLWDEDETKYNIERIVLPSRSCLETPKWSA